MAGYDNLGMAPAADGRWGAPTIGSEQLHSGARSIGDAHPHSAVPNTGAAFANSGIRRAAWTGVAYHDLLTEYLGTGAFPVSCPDSLAARVGSGVPLVARNGVFYPDVLMARLSSGVPLASRNGVAYPELLVAHLGSGGALPAAWNGVAYTNSLAARAGSGVTLVARNGVLYPDVPMARFISGVFYPDVHMARLISGMPPASRNGLAYPELLVAHLGSGGVPPASWNGVAYADWLRARLGSGVPPAPQNAVAYPDGLGAVTAASGTGAVSYIIDVSEGAAGDFGVEHLRTTRVAPAVTEHGGGYNNSGMALPFAVQVCADENRDSVLAGEFTERVRRALPGLGLAVASVAVTGLTAGVPTPATGLGLLAMLVGGLSLVTIRVLRA